MGPLPPAASTCRQPPAGVYLCVEEGGLWRGQSRAQALQRGKYMNKRYALRITHTF